MNDTAAACGAVGGRPQRHGYRVPMPKVIWVSGAPLAYPIPPRLRSRISKFQDRPWKPDSSDSSRFSPFPKRGRLRPIQHPTLHMAIVLWLLLATKGDSQVPAQLVGQAVLRVERGEACLKLTLPPAFFDASTLASGKGWVQGPRTVFAEVCSECRGTRRCHFSSGSSSGSHAIRDS